MDIQEEPQAPNGQQPNWRILSQGLQDLTDQAALIQNVPAIKEGDRILLVLNELRRDVATLYEVQATFQKTVDTMEPEATFQQEQAALKEGHATLEQRLDPLEQRLLGIDQRLASLQLEVKQLRNEITRQ